MCVPPQYLFDCAGRVTYHHAARWCLFVWLFCLVFVFLFAFVVRHEFVLFK